MKTVILDVRTPADSMADFARVWKSGKAEKSARVFPFEAVKIEFMLQAA